MQVEDVGNPEGSALLLLHGFLSSNVQWDLNREALGEHHRLLLAELPGHGRSASPTDAAAYGVDAVVAGIEHIRITHDIDRWWVCGQSLGGAVALRYCLAHPDRVHGVIFTNSRAVAGLRRDGVSSQTPDAAELADLRKLPVHPVHARRFPEALKQRMVMAADAMQPHAVQAVMNHRHSWRSIDDLHRLDLPVLLVNGLWEKKFQLCLDDLRAAVRHLTIVNLEGGHSINVEAPAGFNDAVLAWLAAGVVGK